jgi:hypothetical protein
MPHWLDGRSHGVNEWLGRARFVDVSLRGPDRRRRAVYDFGEPAFLETSIHVPPRDPHPSQFSPAELREQPRVTPARVLGATGAAVFVFGIGFLAHTSAETLPACYAPNRDSCPQPMGAGIPLIVWLMSGLVVGAFVICWPWISRSLRRTVRRESRSTPG